MSKVTPLSKVTPVDSNSVIFPRAVCMAAKFANKFSQDNCIMAKIAFTPSPTCV